MKKFTLTLQSDNGPISRTLRSTSLKQAVETVLDIENAPMRAIKIMKIHAN